MSKISYSTLLSVVNEGKLNEVTVEDIVEFPVQLSNGLEGNLPMTVEDVATSGENNFVNLVLNSYKDYEGTVSHLIEKVKCVRNVILVREDEEGNLHVVISNHYDETADVFSSAVSKRVFLSRIFHGLLSVQVTFWYQKTDSTITIFDSTVPYKKTTRGISMTVDKDGIITILCDGRAVILDRARLTKEGSYRITMRRYAINSLATIVCMWIEGGENYSVVEYLSLLHSTTAPVGDNVTVGEGVQISFIGG